MHYPPPSSACQVWYNGNEFVVAIPPRPGCDKGHCVRFDADLDGFRLLMFMLKERHRDPDARLGSPAVPIQSMIDALRSTTKEPIKAKGPRTAQLREPALSLEDLGL
jgi:hypothetical protein